MRVAVLGASGVAGRAFVDVAHAAGHALETRRVDLFEKDRLAELFEGCHAAVNLVTSIPRPGGRGAWPQNDRLRRDGTATLIAAATQARLPLLVQQSVAMLHCCGDDRPQAEDDPIAGYAMIASAHDMEALARSAPLDMRLVRGALFYGGGSGCEARWLDEVRNPAFRIPGDGQAWHSLVHVHDYASALLAVLEKGSPRTAYIACDDRPLRLHELYARVAARAGVTPPASGGPPRLRSFRVSNAKLCALGWRPAYPELQL